MKYVAYVRESRVVKVEIEAESLKEAKFQANHGDYEVIQETEFEDAKLIEISYK